MSKPEKDSKYDDDDRNPESKLAMRDFSRGELHG